MANCTTSARNPAKSLDAVKINRAIISVSDKTQIAEFAQSLAELGVEIISTGGTRNHLEQAGILVRDITKYTRFPEMMDGRVKTLHPKVFGGILARRGNAEDLAAMAEHDIESIDLVVVNLYPFQQTIDKPGTQEAEAIEQIDIGGPSLVRAAAKNHAHVTVVTDIDQYQQVLDEIRQDGGTRLATRKHLAAAAFRHTAEYDLAIAEYCESRWENESPEQDRSTDTTPFCRTVSPRFEWVSSLRYGENPHQRAALYRHRGRSGISMVDAKFLHGKELSYNNYLDLDSALNIVRSFSAPAVAVIKHNNPCGVAVGDTIEEALRKAMAGDPSSAFGSILGANRTLDEASAEMLATPGLFVEAIVATGYSDSAMHVLTTKPKWKNNVRLLTLENMTPPSPELAMRPITGGGLLQDSDVAEVNLAEWQLVTQTKPTDEQLAELAFCWQVVRHVRSNAIVITQNHSAVGVGAGQMSRIDAVEIALRKSGERACRAVLASDAFFPFPDSIQLMAQAGIAAVIQPGGSKKDSDVIAACDELGIAMLFTGQRHFKH